MARVGEIEYSEMIAGKAEAVWHWSSPAGQLRAARRAQLIADSARLSDDTVVLELGCGTGLFTERFAATGATVTAIDVSPPLLNQAKDRALPDRVEFILEDAEQLTMADATFDAVIGSSVLHHLRVERALQEANRVLKPGGRLAFAEPNMMNPQIALQSKVPLFRRWAGVSPEETAFFRWPLAQQLQKVGFVNIRIRPFDFLHPSVPKPLIPMVRCMSAVFEQLPGMREIAGSLLISAERDSADG